MYRSTKLHGNKYDYSLVTFDSVHDKIKIICPHHDLFTQKVYSHLEGYGCKKCSDQKIRNTKYDFIKKSKSIHGDKYDYSLVDYINNSTKVKIICPDHGIFLQRPKQHIRGENCPQCNQSKGEELIENILKENNISYEKEKKFKECFNNDKLRFDFYLPNKNTCIEFDGIQHFKPVNIFGGIKQFRKQQINDKIKNDYCKSNNIKLLRIRYDQFDNIKNIIGNII